MFRKLRTKTMNTLLESGLRGKINMRKSFSVLVLAVCGSWGASQAMAASSICDAVTGNLVLNCGFETGDFTDWTLTGSTDNPGGNYYGVDAFDANSGSYGAFMSQDFLDEGATSVDLGETLPTTAGGEYQITFYLEQDTAPTLGYNHAFTASWGGSTIESLTPTVASPGTVGSFVEYTFTETTPTASTALEFTFENDDQYWSFDDASVTPVPEPSTALLGGLALGALWLVGRRRKGSVSGRA
jgi:MYXO-CTERM domain-containing protein